MPFAVAQGLLPVMTLESPCDGPTIAAILAQFVLPLEAPDFIRGK
jgi:hypothetical protein